MSSEFNHMSKNIQSKTKKKVEEHGGKHGGFNKMSVSHGPFIEKNKTVGGEDLVKYFTCAIRPYFCFFAGKVIMIAIFYKSPVLIGAKRRTQPQQGCE